MTKSTVYVMKLIFFSTVNYIWTQLYLQDELEKLNKHTEEINKLELQLEDANCLFRTLLTDSTQQLKALSQKVGKKMTLRYAEEVYKMFFLVGTLKWPRLPSWIMF